MTYPIVTEPWITSVLHGIYEKMLDFLDDRLLINLPPDELKTYAYLYQMAITLESAYEVHTHYHLSMNNTVAGKQILRTLIENDTNVEPYDWMIHACNIEYTPNASYVAILVASGDLLMRRYSQDLQYWLDKDKARFLHTDTTRIPLPRLHTCEQFDTYVTTHGVEAFYIAVDPLQLMHQYLEQWKTTYSTHSKEDS